MQPKSIVLLLLALGCGLVASIGITQVIRRPAKDSVAAVGTQPILVATVDIPMGETASASNVKLEPWPESKIPAGALTKVEDVEGRRLRTELFAGEPLVEKKLLAKGASSATATEFIPKGYRVVAVNVDKADGAGLIMPGDRVDVLLHVKRNENMGIKEDLTKTILQDIKVFAVDDIYKLRATDKQDSSIAAKTISLLVNPKQAEKLNMAAASGKVRLVMRGMNDKDVAVSEGLSFAELIGEKKADAADHDKEEPVSDGGLLDFVNKKMSAPAVKTPPAEPQLQPPMDVESRKWSVRVLQGTDVDNVTLEELNEGGIMHWVIQGDEAGNDKDPLAPSLPTAATSTTVEPATPATPADPLAPADGGKTPNKRDNK